MTLTLGDLFANPDHYLFAFEDDMALFREMDRAAYRRSIFLDRRIDTAGPGMMKVPIDALIAHAAPPPLPTAWIFHIAHCGSTLLARGLDRMAASLVLREPVPLRQLAVEGAVAFAGQPATAPWRDGLRLATAMLARRYRSEAPVVVKANVPVNFILPELMAPDPDAKGILLHYDLDNYLAAILRSSNHRAWVAAVTQEIAPAIVAEVGVIAGLDDAELAAALWLAQMRIFARALDRWPALRSLDAEQLFDAPEATLATASGWFGIPPDADESIGMLTSTYAKNPEVAFDNATRVARQITLKRDLADELDRGRRWVRARMSDNPLPDRLPRPLLSQNPVLIDG